MSKRVGCDETNGRRFLRPSLSACLPPKLLAPLLLVQQVLYVGMLLPHFLLSFCRIECVAGKPAVPVHCIVELSSTGSWRESPVPGTPSAAALAHAENRVVTDGYAIVPANTPLINLVPIALEKLGVYSETTAPAKGKCASRLVTFTHTPPCTHQPHSIRQ